MRKMRSLRGNTTRLEAKQAKYEVGWKLSSSGTGTGTKT